MFASLEDKRPLRPNQLPYFEILSRQQQKAIRLKPRYSRLWNMLIPRQDHFVTYGV